MRAVGTGTNGQLSKTQFLYGKVTLSHVDNSLLIYMESQGIYNVYQFLKTHCYISLFEMENISEVSRKDFVQRLKKYNLLNELRVDGKTKRTREFAQRIFAEKQKNGESIFVQ
jgi:hypothetical protein